MIIVGRASQPILEIKIYEINANIVYPSAKICKTFHFIFNFCAYARIRHAHSRHYTYRTPNEYKGILGTKCAIETKGMCIAKLQNLMARSLQQENSSTEGLLLRTILRMKYK